jgi:protocatechuate 3,4-dioxygenase beta subunit
MEQAMTPLPGYRRPPAETQPAYLEPRYVSTLKRAPTRPLILLPHTLSEITGPVFGWDDVRAGDQDLTRQHGGEPIGERIIVGGRVLDEAGRPVPHTLVEIWQANAAGRYRHAVDQHHAPLDPNFTGCGRTLTDAEGRYQFITIKPGAYPWRNHPNAWRRRRKRLAPTCTSASRGSPSTASRPPIVRVSISRSGGACSTATAGR